MTREKAREAAEVMLAFANGEKIEQYYDYDGEWSEVKTRCCDFNWDKNAYRIKPKEKFDPKTLKPFDKVLVRNGKAENWTCDFFSHTGEPYNIYMCISIMGGGFKQCIPYNDKTQHLVGTNKEAPEYYRYWEV